MKKREPKNSNMILDLKILEDFCEDFTKKLLQYKLSYYLKDKSSGKSKENIIHSSIIWTRQAANEINNSKTISGSNEINDLMVLISYIDIMLEATEQIYRVFYSKSNFSPICEERFCFNNVPKEYSKLANKDYFKEIRASFSAHPVNLKTPMKENRFADIPMPRNAISELRGMKCDFYIRIWSATSNDLNTIRFPLYIQDLIDYSKIIYNRYIEFHKRLIIIANKKI